MELAQFSCLAENGKMSVCVTNDFTTIASELGGVDDKQDLIGNVKMISDGKRQK